MTMKKGNSYSKRQSLQRTYLRNMRQRQNAKRSRLFNGNIYAAGEFIFIYAVVFALIGIIWLVCLANMADIKLDDCKVKEVSFCESFSESGEFHIIAEEEKEKNGELVKDKDDYVCSYELINVKQFTDNVKIGDKLTIAYKKGNDKVKQAFVVDSSQTNYLALSNINEKIANSRRVINIVMGIIFGLWAIYVAAGCFVMTNAGKHPKLIRLFVKKSYILPQENSSRKHLHFVDKNKHHF